MTAQRSLKILSNDLSRPIGLMAGWGRFPFAVAEAMRRQGYSVAGIGIRDHADPMLAELCDHFDWIGLGGIGRASRLFRRWGVTRAVMAGKVHKVLLHQPQWWLRHRPDWKCIKTFYPQLLFGAKDNQDDTLLSTLVDSFAEDGIIFEPPTDFAPELLVKAGQVVGRSLTGKQLKDVEFGWRLAKQMGSLDIGQSVCVKNQSVLAVEAIEGTDQCIRRAGELCPAGEFTVVKVAKPQQDMRFDVPTVGQKTLESIAAAGGRVLAIEASRTILLDEPAFRRAAQRLRLSVVAWSDPTFAEAVA